jgi:uncharacterized protein (DUF362 family)
MFTYKKNKQMFQIKNKRKELNDMREQNMKSKVAVVKGENPEHMIHQALSLLGGVENIIPAGRRVILKPNAGHLGAPETAINTSPEFFRAVIRVVRKSNPAAIILAESSAVGCRTDECLKSSGLKKVAQEEGVDEIIDIKSYKKLVTRDIENPTSSIKKVDLPDFLLDDNYFFINLPIFKSHTSMVFSCALKNLKGVVQDKHHVVMHTTDLAGALADLGSVILPDLTIVDMINPMEGYGPHAGTPVHVGCVLAGFDVVSVDATACRIAGLEVGKVDYFDAVAKKGLGKINENDIEILGNSLEEASKKLYMPYLDGFGAFSEYKITCGMACSTCQGLTSFNITRLKSLGYYEKLAGTQIVLGRFKGGKLPDSVDLSKPVHLMGQCSLVFAKKIKEAGGVAICTPGCPPLEPHLSWNMMDGKENVLENIFDEKNLIKKFRIGIKLLRARARMEKETKPFMKWLKTQKRI